LPDVLAFASQPFEPIHDASRTRHKTTKGSHGLVVERYPRQSVVIADGIEVILLRVKGDYASLGVIAPNGVTVTRTEALGDVDHVAGR
jgi:sRNA-binding carbon storage regulator CsrA